MSKRNTLLILAALLAVTPIYAQKFTKKDQARREARAANYFCGATFALTSGYVHSWMTEAPVHNIGIDNSYGNSEKWAQTQNHFDIGFVWDQAFNKKWGLQTGAYYIVKGGDHLYYYDNGLGYGPILRKEETYEASIQNVELQVQARRFFMLQPEMRVSVNAGVFIDKVVGSAKGIRNWNYGLQGGLGYDRKHWSVSATYQQGLAHTASDCKSRQNALIFNLGYRFWKP